MMLPGSAILHAVHQARLLSSEILGEVLTAAFWPHVACPTPSWYFLPTLTLGPALLPSRTAIITLSRTAGYHRDPTLLQLVIKFHVVTSSLGWAIPTPLLVEPERVGRMVLVAPGAKRGPSLQPVNGCLLRCLGALCGSTC